MFLYRRFTAGQFEAAMENARQRGNAGLTSSDVKAIERHFAAGGVFTRGMAVVMKDKKATGGVLAAWTS